MNINHRRQLARVGIILNNVALEIQGTGGGQKSGPSKKLLIRYTVHFSILQMLKNAKK